MANTVDWPVRVSLVEEGGMTTARAVLDTGTTTFTGRGTARCSPEDPDVPEIGDEIAAGRALKDLAGQLLRVADDDLQEVGAAPPRRENRMAYGWTNALA
ncbi:dsRBD fold-containing protein [Streptomyces sp. NPDC001339]|uniref:dsRBD fold-containing protein n=1 Tax=Streptomyces sp. NPDC001339 TaxID=3364563 RepID=UPI00367B346C